VDLPLEANRSNEAIFMRITNCPRCQKLCDIDSHECPGSFAEQQAMRESQLDKERIVILENQVKLLWEVLLRLPRLEGVDDAILLAGLKCEGLQPLRFKG
jgi:hypothetical protein